MDSSDHSGNPITLCRRSENNHIIALIICGIALEGGINYSLILPPGVSCPTVNDEMLKNLYDGYIVKLNNISQYGDGTQQLAVTINEYVSSM